MIVVLCDSFEQAVDAYECFVGYLEANMPWCILNIWNASQCVETDENLRYIFVDRRFGGLFWKTRPDIIGVQEFFKNMEELYV